MYAQSMPSAVPSLPPLSQQLRTLLREQLNTRQAVSFSSVLTHTLQISPDAASALEALLSEARQQRLTPTGTSVSGTGLTTNGPVLGTLHGENVIELPWLAAFADSAHEVAHAEQARVQAWLTRLPASRFARNATAQATWQAQQLEALTRRWP